MLTQVDRQIHLAELSALSARIAADLGLIQGAGGNVSVKLAGRELWVKASGKWLAAAERENVFVGLDLPGLLERIASGNPEEVLDLRLPESTTLRPSIETTLHALLPHRIVLHVHSVNAIAHAMREDGALRVAGLLNGLRWAWVPYARPGLPLTRQVQALMAGEPDILVLGNHGLVIGADDVDAAEALLSEVERRLHVAPRSAPPPDLARLDLLSAAFGDRFRPARLAAAHDAATDPASLALARRGAFYPDHVVFLGRAPVACLTADGQGPPRDAPLVLVPGAGTLVRADLSPGAEAMVACLGLVLARTDPAAPLRILDLHEEAELLGWDAEQYRQSLNAA